MRAVKALGIDFGEKRIGLAISDPAGRMAVPLVTLERRNDRSAVRQIAAIAREERVTRLVLGEPVAPDGSRGEWNARVRRFGERLAEMSGLPLELVVESLTSVEAEELLREAGAPGRRSRRPWGGLGRRVKSRIDAVAAQILLQEALDRRPQKDIAPSGPSGANGGRAGEDP